LRRHHGQEWQLLPLHELRLNQRMQLERLHNLVVQPVAKAIERKTDNSKGAEEAPLAV
jgi:hypothetical protein